MRVFFTIFLLLVFISFSFCEIVVISSLKSYSHIYEGNTLFFSDIFLEVYGGNKYGGGIVIKPFSEGYLSNTYIGVEKIEFFVNVLDLFRVAYWYGSKEYIGYLSSFQTRFYQINREFDFRGWYVIDGTGLDFSFSFLGNLLGLDLYFYRNSLGNDGIGSAGLKLTSVYRDVQVTLFSGVSEGVVRGGFEFRTLFRFLNASAGIGVDNISFTNFNIQISNVYVIAEERFNFVSADGLWGFNQTITFLMKPLVYKSIRKPSNISDVDLRGLLGLMLFKNLSFGGEVIISLYNVLSSITQIGFSSELGFFVGFEENNILIKLQPMFLVINATTNQLMPFRFSILGELRF
ncbi:MAG: hypothetical protein ACK4F9_01615 [Brevinematia bacterium]